MYGKWILRVLLCVLFLYAWGALSLHLSAEESTKALYEKPLSSMSEALKKGKQYLKSLETEFKELQTNYQLMKSSFERATIALTTSLDTSLRWEESSILWEKRSKDFEASLKSSEAQHLRTIIIFTAVGTAFGVVLGIVFE